MSAAPESDNKDAVEYAFDEVTRLRLENQELRRDVKRLKNVLAAFTKPRLPHAEPEGFAGWYERFPRRVSRDDAAKAYRQKILGSWEYHLLIENTVLWVKRWADEDRELKNLPYPATFLRAGTWREPPPEE